MPTARHGRSRHLRQVAVDALSDYDLDVDRLELVSHRLNAVYRVVDARGARFALRLGAPAWRDDVELRSEIHYLLALARETDLEAPVPLMNRAGEHVTTVVGDLAEPRRCVLFSWVPGVEVGRRLSRGTVERMGELSATLHQHGRSFVPDGEFTTRRLDRLFPRGETAVIFSPDHGHLESPAQRDAFDRARELAESELRRLDAEPAGRIVVHGDLHQGNIKAHGGKLRPIDFEDVIWAHPIQDIALTLFELRYYSDPARHRYDDLCDWFRSGYERVSPWPQEHDRQIDTLHVARELWVANWVVTNEEPVHHRPFLDRLAARFQRFVETSSS